ncbi:MAG: NRDE family protein [Flavobacteriaceae bacterium]|nr:NRDE family protein [Flavobacteriaceae bacterium]
MCTVTYIPLGNNDFILTSSRDVPYERERASQPEKYVEKGIELWYPKDGKAGGTWIGLSSKKRLICLLNGAFKYHTSRSNYKKSRGLIVKELLRADKLKSALKNIDLIGIEEFTLTIINWDQKLELIEFVWDGKDKHLKSMLQEPYIWSSSTLYDENVKQLRWNWFADWKKLNDFSQDHILAFHHNAGIGDPNIDVLMDRELGGTVSITSIKKEDNLISFHYEDVKEQRKSELILDKI